MLFTPLKNLERVLDPGRAYLEKLEISEGCGLRVQAWGPRGVFALTAVFPLVVSAAAVLIDEQPAAAGPRLLKPDRTYLSAP